VKLIEIKHEERKEKVGDGRDKNSFVFGMRGLVL